jgi:hypothetical protein
MRGTMMEPIAALSAMFGYGGTGYRAEHGAGRNRDDAEAARHERQQ